MTADTRNRTPKSSLTLSAVADLLPEDSGAVAAIEHELAAVDAGELEAVERIVVFVWPYTERDAPIITESELRLLDGNR